MTKDDVIKLFSLMTLHFDNFKMAEPEKMVDAWLLVLQEYNYEDVMTAYTTYLKSNLSGFLPSISQIVGLIEKTADLANYSASEAWAKVRVAIGRSGRYANEEFAKLDPLMQKAVGSADQLYYWATDANFNDGVVMALFEKNYLAILQRDAEERRLPASAKLRLEQLRNEKAAQIENNVLLLGKKADKLQEGDFDYDTPQRPDEETLGHYAQQLREKLGVQ